MMKSHQRFARPRLRAGLTIGLGLGILPALAGFGAAPRRLPRAKPAPVRYSRDIRPIVAENCFACHGTDHNKRMANLRLDDRAVAVARGAIVPGKPQQSRLIARIFAPEPARRMPPLASHKSLTAAQKDLLRRWIAEGARYEPHWAFAPVPARVPLPPVRNAAWCRNPIDRFMLARLEQAGLKPSPEAERAVLLRRVTLDLTGLPPTPAEIDRFLKDRSPHAYEKVVDRLLASPHFGERMATPWLDVARYADSYGYQSDQLCPTWPYRDWVVGAFNRDLPYDRFVTEQIAGDLLPKPTREQRLATAFNRLHRMTNEGGSVPEEWRQEGVADRVKTFGTAFLGLTVECARCHDHKYDPISQRDYYSLSAFFNSIDEYGLYDRADIVPSPSLLLPTPEQERELEDARRAVTDAEQALAKIRERRASALREWLGHSRALALPDMAGRFDFERFDGAALPNLAPGATQNGRREDEVALVEGHSGKAAQFDGENNINFPGLGNFGRHTPFTIAFWMRDPRAEDPEATSTAAVVFQACSGTDTGPHGYDLLVEQGRLTARLFRHWPGNAIAVRTVAAVPKYTWTHVAVIYDGSSRAAGLRITLDGKPAALETVRDHLCKDIGDSTLVFGQRFRDRGFKGGRIDDLYLFKRALSPLEIAQLADEHSLTAALAQPAQHQDALRDYYFSAIDADARAASAALTAARQKLVTAEDAAFEIPVMEEMPHPRPTYMLARGRYDAPKRDADRVGRDTPAAIFPFPKGGRRDRLGLAQWLVDPRNPLTARVAVNRVWATLFGRGLVETVEDFGTQGKPPSHPELLDWLARAFAAPPSVVSPTDREREIAKVGLDRECEIAKVRNREENEKKSRASRDPRSADLDDAPILTSNHSRSLRVLRSFAGAPASRAQRSLSEPLRGHPTPNTAPALGWSVKRLVRLIVTSATYRQASALRPELRARDPENVLLARGPSGRLSAEMIRDVALAAGGLLDDRLGGPPVSPYQPGDLWRESNSMSPPYHQSVGRDLYRRSLYTVWKRTAPMPNMLAFDAVSREVCTARRQTTNTPLQALVLLDDPQFVEAARVLAERALKGGGGTAAERIRFTFRCLATREPAPEEMKLLLTLYAEQRAIFAGDPAGAAKLIAIGERKPDAALPPVELAAMTEVAQAILNADATVWKR